MSLTHTSDQCTDVARPLSGCWSQMSTLQKQINWSWCRLGCELGWVKKHFTRWWPKSLTGRGTGVWSRVGQDGGLDPSQERALLASYLGMSRLSCSRYYQPYLVGGSSNAAFCCQYCSNTHTHTHLTALFPGLPRWAGTRKVKPIWILMKQETVSGSGITWTYASLHLTPDR